MDKRTISLVLVVVLWGAAIAPGATVTVTTADGNGADTALSNDSNRGPDVVWGAYTTLEIRNYPAVRFKCLLLRFDLAGVPGEVTSGSLSITFTDPKRSANLNVYGMQDSDLLDNWSEATTRRCPPRFPLR